MDIKDGTGGANPSYQGYDYQKLVTVWVALELMFGPNACADSIIVEPASHDDVLARLAVSDDVAEASLNVGSGELHVQIKFKGAGHWSAKDFASVINDKPAKGSRGPATRPRAKVLLLKEPSRRYLFITNTSVDGVLAQGRVSVPSQRSSPTFLPTNLKLSPEQKAQLSGRFGLIEQMTLTETRRQIDQLLTQHLRVPTQNLNACINRLKRLVEDRFLEVPDPLRKNDIEKIAEGLGGLPHANPQLARYVPPANRTEADQRLNRLGAVLLIGPSGYGKSLTAESLAYERRQANPPFKVVRETAGLAAIEEAFAAPGRVLFHLEDPWGQSGLDKDGAAQWTSRLRTLIPHASSEKQFVITSRTEVYREALGELPAPVWADRTVSIDDGAYDLTARQSILHGKLKLAGSWRQDLANQHEARLLNDLRTPLEIDTFTRELIAVSNPAQADIGKLVDRALTDSRKQVVMDHVRGFGDRGVGGAAVLWALLRLSRDLDPARLRDLRRALDRAKGPDIAVDDLADHLAQTQLAVGADGAYSAHGKVVEALESLARTYPRTAETALNATANAACDLVSTDIGWLDELQRLVDGVRQLQDKGVVLDDDVSRAVDAFLTEVLVQSVGNASKFRSAWQAANRRLSGTTPIGQLVRWLERGVPRKKGGLEFGWRPPEITAADRQAVLAADPKLRVVTGFVAHILPWTSNNYDADDLLPWLEKFGVDLTKAFLAAGDEVVRTTHFVMSADAISECALGWPSPPNDKVWTQILTLDIAVDAALNASHELRRQAWQGELDFAEQLTIQEQSEEEGPSASHYAKGYVRARRRQEGYDWIPIHPRPDLILPLWAELMKSSRPKVTAGELDAFFVAAGDNDRLQAAGLSVIGERRLTFARDRLLKALTTGGPNTLEAAVRALSWLESEGQGASGRSAAEIVLLNALPKLPTARAAMLAPLIADLQLGKERADAAARALAVATPPSRAAVHLALARALGTDDETLLQIYRELAPGEAAALMVHGPRTLARILLVLSALDGVNIDSIAHAWVKSDDATDAQAALAALAQGGGAATQTTIAAALDHSDFQVRRRAMQLLAPVVDQRLHSRILELATDKSAPVREALAEVIGEQSWNDGLETLVKLLSDIRDYTPHPEQQRRIEPQFNVARAAADALTRFDNLPSAVVGSIITFLDAGAKASTDVGVHTKLLGILAAADDPRIWLTLERLLEDDRVVGLEGENLYPARYAAAWCIVRRLWEWPLELGSVPWTAIETAADHLDPQLAAPALAALGCRLATTCDASTLAALRGQSASPARTALALSMIDDRDQARDISVRYALPPVDHPLFETGEDISSDEASFPRWPLTAQGRDWLASIADGTDVEPVLLWMMSRRTGIPLGATDFAPTALRRRKGIPLVTFSEMFGME